MSNLQIVAFVIASPFALWTAFRLWALASGRSRIARFSAEVIGAHFHKVDKIPVMVESIRKYAPENEAYEELIDLHRSAIVANVTSVYDVLEADARISGKLRFLLKLSVRIPDLVHDGNFLYARNLWMFYESASKNAMAKLDREIEEYERLRRTRGRTIFSIFVPVKEAFPVKIG